MTLDQFLNRCLNNCSAPEHHDLAQRIASLCNRASVIDDRMTADEKLLTHMVERLAVVEEFLERLGLEVEEKPLM